MTSRKRKRRNKKHTPRKPSYHIVRLSGVAQAEAIGALLVEGFGEDAGARATVFIGTTWYGAIQKDTGELAAVAGVLPSAIEAGTWYLNRAFVSPEHRGAGLQRKLIRARVQHAKDNKGVACTSDTYEAPYSANNLISCGFRAFEPKQRWRGEGVMYWRLVLRVPK